MTQEENSLIKTFCNFLWVNTPPESEVVFSIKGDTIIISLNHNENTRMKSISLSTLKSRKNTIKRFAYEWAKKLIQ